MINNLDDISSIEQIDAGDMLGSIAQFPEHLEKSFLMGTENANYHQDINQIVFFGLGGSATAGEVICQKLGEQCQTPSRLIRRSYLPKYIDQNTLCIALSYSGNTKETIACYKQAFSKGAAVISISSGGELEQLSSENKTTFVKLPTGYQPRAALGLLIGASLGCLSKAKLVEDLPLTIKETVSLLTNLKNQYIEDIPTAKNLAKQIATDILGHIPLIYTSETLGLAVSNRWKNQLNENSKVMAYGNVFPELAHNEIMSDNQQQKPIIIYLYNPDEETSILETNRTALELIKPQTYKIVEIASNGISLLAKTLSTILLGDYISTYLAIRRQIDPTPVDRIIKLKSELRKIDKIAASPLQGSSQ